MPKSKTRNTKPARGSRTSSADRTKPKPAKASRPAPKARPAAARAEAPAAKLAVRKATKPVAAPIAVADPPAATAPAKFRREYPRWKDTLISLRHRLLQEGSHLEEEGLKALEQEVSVDHMADFGSDSSEQETTLQLIESNSLSLRDVDDALKRIDARTYGLCEDCETLIPSARLQVLPHARLCIQCQEKREGMPA